ncbi:PRC-barrel domain-containing protein [Roseobacter sp. N2S]|uniref:PRC-barrel domain-containing protein n=1 Tax=Roseobacter sp. N2S TaxID=2663844 RepID=UPI00285E2887|nr:PRC-barrel domain-containing protein [Roseobacter sp. N2S]MDR6267635.1 hypothetical protein [Roseobacter sp. N2S]
MKNLMMTTAAAVLLGTTAYAESHSATPAPANDTEQTQPAAEADTGTTMTAEEPKTMDETAPEAPEAEAPEAEAPAAMEETTTMDETKGMMAPGIERDGYQPVVVKDLTAEDLTGARVYGLNDEDVGEISELVLTDAGMVDKAVIDVGGFLGIGEKPVAVAMDELTIITNDAGDDLRVYIDSTEEALEARPEYEG